MKSYLICSPLTSVNSGYYTKTFKSRDCTSCHTSTDSIYPLERMTEAMGNIPTALITYLNRNILLDIP
jgi:hypothetical protein